MAEEEPKRIIRRPIRIPMKRPIRRITPLISPKKYKPRQVIIRTSNQLVTRLPTNKIQQPRIITNQHRSIDDSRSSIILKPVDPEEVARIRARTGARVRARIRTKKRTKEMIKGRAKAKAERRVKLEARAKRRKEAKAEKKALAKDKAEKRNQKRSIKRALRRAKAKKRRRARADARGIANRGFKIKKAKVVDENYSQDLLPKPKRKKYYLSVQSKFKNEERYLKEWLDFHLLVGVRHFYLYDEESDDQSYLVLKPYIEKGIVTYIFWENGQARYDRGHCVENYGRESNWIAFIDLDEFLFATQANQFLPKLLVGYEKYPAVVVNWVYYGHNFHKQYESGYVIERFYRRGKNVSTTIKTILQPDQVIVKDIMEYGHNTNYLEGRLSVNEDQKYVFGKTRIPYQSANIFRINHYQIKSKEEFKQKYQKLSSRDNRLNGYSGRLLMSPNINYYNDLEDKILFRYLSKLKDQSYLDQIYRRCPK